MLTTIVLTPGGSSTVHIYTQTIHRTTEVITNLEECGPCPVFANFTLAFALQLWTKYGKTSARVAEEENARIHITKAPIHYKTYTYIHTHTHTLQNPHITKPTHTHIHTLQNPHIHTPTHYNAHTYTHQHITNYTYIYT